MSETSVLVVGAGPVGLTAALELRRRGVDVVIVDRLPEPPQYAKAVGIQPRTLEVWDAMGVVRPSLDVSAPMHGQIVYVDGRQVMRLELELPEDVPYRFVCMPQYATERVLTQALAEHGTVVRRGIELTGFEQTADGVVADLRDGDDTTRLAARYLVGCDGAHSAVRKGLGVSFDGDAFPEEYMLADVELDWSMPGGYGIRASTTSDGTTTDMMVCIPLPGTGRYRLSTFVAPDLATSASGAGAVAHGLEGGRRPTLGHIQAVLDRLAPEPTRAGALRWSSVFRISHRLAGSYGGGPGVPGRRRRAHPSPDRGTGHEHRHPGRLQPRLEARAGGAGTRCRRPARQLRRRAPARRGGGGGPHRAARPAGPRGRRDGRRDRDRARGPAAARLPGQPARR